jgi:hypothetical protein
VKAFVGGLTLLPNLKEVSLKIKTKNEKVREVLEVYQKKNLFPTFKAVFEKYEDNQTI